MHNSQSDLSFFILYIGDFYVSLMMDFIRLMLFLNGYKIQKVHLKYKKYVVKYNMINIEIMNYIGYYEISDWFEFINKLF
jgi:hypothetical protein